MLSRRKLADAIRILSMDAVEKARSGHPGAPMGMADMAEVLWRDFLVHNPLNPAWPNRDRFVLSNGHASMLLYSLLHLSGYDLAIDDIKNFRQLGSKTPGHPEYGVTPGVETSTGPLGQGFANAVGMALAERALAAEFNIADDDKNFNIIDHYTYCFVGDGCLMEGISHEAASLAGTLGLGKLIVLYDSNGISIDGKIDGWFNEDVPARFKAYGWHVVKDVNGHDCAAVARAVKLAQKTKNRPSIICCKTHIGFGSPNKVNSASCHGSPLGESEIKATRAALNWNFEPFVIPDEIYKEWDARPKGKRLENAWNKKYSQYATKHPALAKELERRLKGDLPETFSCLTEKMVKSRSEACENIATRVASQNVLSELSPHLPELLGGSADLTGSVGTLFKGAKAFTPENPRGRYLHYGVREFAMTAILNGVALHGGFIPYAGTFLVFSDYACNALRLAALMKIRAISVLTHDSIGVGEDGPTHQPVEQLASLRYIPNLMVWRPCDTVETAAAWSFALKYKGPSALALSRQNLPCASRTSEAMSDIERGGYILRDPHGAGESTHFKPDVIIIATGSEVELALKAAESSTLSGYHVRVVSMPCPSLFEQQAKEYRDFVLPPTVRARVAVEAAHEDYWKKYTALDGQVIGMTGFGDSAPAKDLFAHFNITAEAVAEAAKKLIKNP